jgi:hypothetical protein
MAFSVKIVLALVCAAASLVASDVIIIDHHCMDNEVFVKCGTPCEPVCNHRVEKCEAKCVPACQCRHGFVRESNEPRAR